MRPPALGNRAAFVLARGVAARARGRRITLVAGTHGKSTTTAMITAALRTGAPVATNAGHANTPHGLVWTVATASADDIVLEVDEAFLPWAVRTLQPAVVVLLNLTRDRWHRRPEIWPVADAWRRALRDVPRVVASADDPTVVWATLDASEVIYVGTGAAQLADALCPRCRQPLHDRAGGWWCPCGLARPAYVIGVGGDRVVIDGVALDAVPTLKGSAEVADAAMAVAAVHGRVSPTAALEAIHVSFISGRLPSSA